MASHIAGVGVNGLAPADDQREQAGAGGISYQVITLVALGSLCTWQAQQYGAGETLGAEVTWMLLWPIAIVSMVDHVSPRILRLASAVALIGAASIFGGTTLSGLEMVTDWAGQLASNASWYEFPGYALMTGAVSATAIGYFGGASGALAREAQQLLGPSGQQFEARARRLAEPPIDQWRQGGSSLMNPLTRTQVLFRPNMSRRLLPPFPVLSDRLARDLVRLGNVGAIYEGLLNLVYLARPTQDARAAGRFLPLFHLLCAEAPGDVKKQLLPVYFATFLTLFRLVVEDGGDGEHYGLFQNCLDAGGEASLRQLAEDECNEIRLFAAGLNPDETVARWKSELLALESASPDELECGLSRIQAERLTLQKQVDHAEQSLVHTNLPLQRLAALLPAAAKLVEWMNQAPEARRLAYWKQVFDREQSDEMYNEVRRLIHERTASLPEEELAYEALQLSAPECRQLCVRLGLPPGVGSYQQAFESLAELGLRTQADLEAAGIQGRDKMQALQAYIDARCPRPSRGLPSAYAVLRIALGILPCLHQGVRPLAYGVMIGATYTYFAGTNAELVRTTDQHLRRIDRVARGMFTATPLATAEESRFARSDFFGRCRMISEMSRQTAMLLSFSTMSVPMSFLFSLAMGLELGGVLEAREQEI